MKKLYTIGETAKIMGLSVQTLRNYTKSSLLSPAYINEETGYRYFSFDQFHIIDRIKYLRTFGLSLSEISQIMNDGNIDSIVHFLEKQKEKVERQMEELTMTKEDIQWYINYFKYLNKSNHNKLPHVTHFKERTILFTPCEPGQTIEDIEVNLASIRTKLDNLGIRFYRQFGYFLSYDSIIDKDWKPYLYFLYVSDIPDNVKSSKAFEPYKEQIITIPEGDYLCFSFRLRHMEELNINLINEYFLDRKQPPYVIANEHEDNLSTYTCCPYELQFLLD